WLTVAGRRSAAANHRAGHRRSAVGRRKIVVRRRDSPELRRAGRQWSGVDRRVDHRSTTPSFN
ncbi:hypothetical protein A2U01_0083703, partial [Trifolium medium]|nr:hypothetical protein [Trifolium medium]